MAKKVDAFTLMARAKTLEDFSDRVDQFIEEIVSVGASPDQRAAITRLFDRFSMACFEAGGRLAVREMLVTQAMQRLKAKRQERLRVREGQRAIQLED